MMVFLLQSSNQVSGPMVSGGWYRPANCVPRDVALDIYALIAAPGGFREHAPSARLSQIHTYLLQRGRACYGS